MDESFVSTFLGEYTPPSLPDRATVNTVRSAVAEALAGAKAYEVADECVRFGMEPPEGDENPFNGKARYVERKLRGYSLEELITLGHRVVVDYPTRELENLISLASAGGVAGELKNLIFPPKDPSRSSSCRMLATTTSGSRRMPITASSTIGCSRPRA